MAPGQTSRGRSREPRAAPLVVATGELRWLARSWLVVGGAALVAQLVLGGFGRFTAIEGLGTFLLFGLSTSGALGGLLLGTRTGPAILFARIFERAPPPPPDAMIEPSPRTALRSIGLALLLVAGMAPMAFVGLAGTLVVLGTPRDEVIDHLVEGTTAVVAGWALVCGIAALMLARYFARWELAYGRLILCLPLRSGVMRPVYYAAEPPRAASRV